MAKNPPAFPRTGQWQTSLEYTTKPQEGMSLRDYFAAHAMQGLFAGYFRDRVDMAGTEEIIAGWSYCMADAMLKAREASK